MVHLEVEFGSRLWLAQDFSRTHLLYLRRQEGWGAYEMILPYPAHSFSGKALLKLGILLKVGL